MSTENNAPTGGLLDDSDTARLAAVRDLYDRIDPMPSGLVDQICFALTMDDAEAELAELVDAELAGVRSTIDAEMEQARTVIFESSSVTIMVSVTPLDADRVRVDGWLSPEGVYRVELRTPNEQLRESSDDTGRFVITDVPSEVFRLVIRLPESLASKDNPPVVLTPSISWN
ncbi:hypothetical protein [Stackebrandtia soli]|uniref:hypothetical protein n=1 Tax=Stackebrandtia soli TaxID=1892856 RepID=UPI0039EA8185